MQTLQASVRIKLEEKKVQKNEDCIKSLWDNIKRPNIHFIGVPEGEEKEQEIVTLSENIVKENFPNLVKEIGLQVHEVTESKL